MSETKSCIKKACAVVLSFSVFFSLNEPACQAIAEETAYSVQVAEKSTMQNSGKAKVSVYYPNSVNVMFESQYGYTQFIQFVALTGDYVEKGQPIAEIYTYVDEMEKIELDIKIARAQEELDDFESRMEDEIALLWKNVEKESGNKRVIAKLDYEKQKKQYESKLSNLKSQVSNLESRKRLLETAEKTTTIDAPIEGIVSWTAKRRWGDTIWSGSTIATINDTSNALFTVKDQTGVFRYGMKVKLQDVKGNEFEGSIISSNSSSLSQTLMNGQAYIYAEGADPLVSYEAVYSPVYMENAIVIQASAIKSDDNGRYVHVLENGRPTKKYIVVAKTLNGKSYVISGLNEGEKVVLN